ncbi:hypothetical protein FRP1_20100 [Pseudonocardia sp. EC080625-04]|nr:hypothetical protein FRP1_20100 [Pseudonocardia sp. EC080625-04]
MQPRDLVAHRAPQLGDVRVHRRRGVGDQLGVPAGRDPGRPLPLVLTGGVHREPLGLRPGRRGRPLGLGVRRRRDPGSLGERLPAQLARFLLGGSAPLRRLVVGHPEHLVGAHPERLGRPGPGLVQRGGECVGPADGLVPGGLGPDTGALRVGEPGAGVLGCLLAAGHLRPGAVPAPRRGRAAPGEIGGGVPGAGRLVVADVLGHSVVVDHVAARPPVVLRCGASPACPAGSFSCPALTVGQCRSPDRARTAPVRRTDPGRRPTARSRR